MSKISKPIVITPGEPAGIGPDLAISISRRTLDTSPVIIADPDMLLARARMIGDSLRIVEYQPGSAPLPHVPGQLTVLPCKLAHPAVPGVTDTANAAYVLSTLDQAIDGCLSGEFAAMVTGPVHKAVINQAGTDFTGHTEYIAKRCGIPFPVMMLMNQYLRVALVTTHIPLSRVAAAINRELIETVIRIVHQDLVTKFGITSPRILVCGLNPHAGESGYLGHEEQEFIEPVIASLRTRGLDLTGPVPADTAFTRQALDTADVVISMYHDQGLPVLKSHGFGETVNLTLGLPIVRT
ncbi:MAG: 4-hydroxythreonine-4-phosphate dehydrogenase PdxA, partial [Gammaproteobacteria bacterium]